MGSPGCRRQALPGGEAKELRPRGREPPAHVEESGQVGGRHPGGGVRRTGRRSDRGLRRPVDRSRRESNGRIADTDRLPPPQRSGPRRPGREPCQPRHEPDRRLRRARSRREAPRVLHAADPGYRARPGARESRGLQLRVPAVRDTRRGRPARSRARRPRGVRGRGHPAGVPVLAIQARSTGP